MKDSTTIFLTLPDWSGTTRAPESNAGACNSDIDGSSTYRVGCRPARFHQRITASWMGLQHSRLTRQEILTLTSCLKLRIPAPLVGRRALRRTGAGQQRLPPRAPLISTVLASIRRPARSKPQRGRSPITTSFTKRRVSFPIFFSRTFARSHTFRPHRLNLYVVLRKLISKLQAFSQSENLAAAFPAT